MCSGYVSLKFDKWSVPVVFGPFNYLSCQIRDLNLELVPSVYQDNFASHSQSAILVHSIDTAKLSDLLLFRVKQLMIDVNVTFFTK